MIPRLKPGIGWAEFKATLRLASRDDINAFERSFAALAQQKYALAFPYGRTAMVAILRALDLQNAEIICPSYTCVVVPHAIVTGGNTPVFVDPSPQDFNMDLDLVEEAITSETRAIVATSLFGHPVNIETIRDLSARFPDLYIIQDCAHSFFCDWEGQPVHREGICAFYGLNISKIMTSIFGGMVTTDNREFAEKLRQVRSSMLAPGGLIKSLARRFYLYAVYVAFTRPVYGMVNRLERSGLLDRFVRYYDPGLIDMPDDYLVQITSIEARVGIAQCAKYGLNVEHRRKLARIYLDGLSDVENVSLPSPDSGATWSHFVLRTSHAKQLEDHFLQHGIQLGKLVDYYIPDMSSYHGYKTIGSGAARALPDEVLNLPVHMGVNIKDARRIVLLIRENV